MTERMVIEANWTYVPFVLKSGEVAEKGHLACLDTTQSGKVVKGATSLTLIPLGIFQENLTGDGVKKISVKLFAEIKPHWWDNDATVPVVAADIASPCFIKDSHTVSGDDTGRSYAGLVLAVNAAKGVLVYQPLPTAIPDVDAP